VPEHTVDELRAVFLARDLRNGEIGCCGVGAAIPFAAMRLAQETHAPDLVIALEGSVNPRPTVLVESPVDPRMHSEPEAITDLYDLFVASERGLDFWFMSAVQTDRHGNLNHFRIGGTPQRPAFRAPGVGNVSLAATSVRWYNCPGSHTPRSFVAEVDFISALGNGARRRELGERYGAGCRYVVSPLAILDFTPVEGLMQVRHLMPGVSIEQVRESTGFEISCAEEVGPPPPPTPEELELLRRVVDPEGVLRR
jgi:glutaconate CoA-transferase subunit B